MQTFQTFVDVLARVNYPGFSFRIGNDAFDTDAVPLLFLQVVCDEGVCNVSGQQLIWRGRKWRLSPYMTDGEVVQTAFMAVMAANEHETREKFTYRGVSVFDPHYNIEKLVELRSQPDALQERD